MQWLLSALSFLAGLFKRGPGDNARADFSAVTDRWEKLTDAIEEERSWAQGQIHSLRRELRGIQKELAVCVKDRIAQEKEIAELRGRIKRIEGLNGI